VGELKRRKCPFLEVFPNSQTLPARTRKRRPPDSSRGHRRICSKTYFKRHRRPRSADLQGRNLLFGRFGRPDVVAIEADELPAERSDVGKELVAQRFALGAKLSRARQYRYSASKPLSYCSKAACSPPRRPAKPARRSTPYRDIQAREHAWALRVRFGTDFAMTPFSQEKPDLRMKVGVE
jgi:hypothetical protein